MWEETRSGSPSPVLFSRASLYGSLCFSLQTKVFRPQIPARESWCDQPIHHPTNQCPSLFWAITGLPLVCPLCLPWTLSVSD